MKSYTKILLYITLSWYFQEINGNKYLALVLNDESKLIMETYVELWSNIKNLIGLKANNSDD